MRGSAAPPPTGAAAGAIGIRLGLTAGGRRWRLAERGIGSGRRAAAAWARLAAAGIALAVACGEGETQAPARHGPAQDWPAYGGDDGGMRYSPLVEITPANVSRLRLAWEFHTGEPPSDGSGELRSTTAFEGTPLLVDETLYLCTPMNQVIALDPETGRERWRYDPKIDRRALYANQAICRGVSTWLDPERAAVEPCRRRLFTATNDARLIALDARTGRPCRDFGAGGEIDLNPAAGRQWWKGEYQVTSPPAIGRDVVIVGSAVSDNQRDDAPSGVVRAFDGRDGRLRWAWDLAPPGFEYTAENSSEAGYALSTPNVWAPMAVDRARDLVFVPTGNPSPDYYRGADSDLGHYGSSVVALRASSGEVVWAYQTVHRDRWDYDVPAQPTLFPLRRGGAERPAVVQATKMGFLFVLDRETGEPLFAVEERPVPQIAVPGEKLSPTQPFPSELPHLVPMHITPDEAWGITPWDRGACRDRIAALRFEGIFTPPTLEGSLMLPGNAGGANWGGAAVDPERQLVVVNTQNLAWAVTLFPGEEFEAQKARHPEAEVSPQKGKPYGMRRELLLSPLGVPCVPPPWGELAAVDLATGELRWQVPLGTLRDITPFPLPIEVGVPNVGGPLLTASGLVFIGATLDSYLRAYDVETGELLWRGRLPAGGQATPMTYRVRDGGRQLVVIAAGGYGRAGNTQGDSLVAFALE
jgi:quinoprotein glucose dehydrogenase